MRLAINKKKSNLGGGGGGGVGGAAGDQYSHYWRSILDLLGRYDLRNCMHNPTSPFTYAIRPDSLYTTYGTLT